MASGQINTLREQVVKLENESDAKGQQVNTMSSLLDVS